MVIAELTESHYLAIKAIYPEGIATGNATFQTEAPGRTDWDKGHLRHSRIVTTDNANFILGWAALSPVSNRCVYAGVAEVSIYTGAKHRGKGVGDKLMQELVNSSAKNGIWTLQAGIFPENTISIKRHEKYGFRVFGRREKIGKMKDNWRDTLLLERRSTLAGV